METTSLISLLLSVTIGGFIGWCLHFYLTKNNINNKRKSDGIMNSKASDEQKKLDFSPENKPTSQRKKQVVFNSTAEKEKSEESKTQQDDQSVTEESGDEEEEMLPFKNRSIKHNFPSTSKETADEDSADKINSTLGKLHGKLATAQLKAKTRQLAAVMSDEEKEYEKQMKDNQMASILKLMMQNQEKFGMSSDDIKEQMNLYNF